MAIDMYSTHVLRGVVRSLPQPPSFFLDNFFPQVQEEESEEIHFDVEVGGRRITPFVSPLVAGKVVQNRGFQTKTFKPAYAKDKRHIQPNQPHKRVIGEAIGGSMSNMERRAAVVRDTIADQLEMLTRREEVMAAEVLLTGKVTVAGDGFATTVVDFGRAAGLTVAALTGDDRWSVDIAASNPLEDIEAWGTLIQSNGGGVATDVVFKPDAWAAFRTRLIARGEAALLFDFMRTGGSSAQFAPVMRDERAKFVGQIDMLNLWVYDDTYVNDAGSTVNLLPTAGSVVMVSRPNILGARAYGMIQDEKAGYRATRFFVKSWLEEDPAVRWILLQTAPLVVPYRPNASLSVVVL